MVVTVRFELTLSTRSMLRLLPIGLRDYKGIVDGKNLIFMAYFWLSWAATPLIRPFPFFPTIGNITHLFTHYSCSSGTSPPLIYKMLKWFKIFPFRGRAGYVYLSNLAPFSSIWWEWLELDQLPSQCQWGTLPVSYIPEIWWSGTWTHPRTPPRPLLTSEPKPCGPT